MNHILIIAVLYGLYGMASAKVWLKYSTNLPPSLPHLFLYNPQAFGASNIYHKML